MKGLRDAVAVLAAIVVLLGLIMMFSPRVRERVSLITSDAQSQQWDAPNGPIGSVASTAVNVTSNYASTKPFLFSFVVAAAVLFVFMLRT